MAALIPVLSPVFQAVASAMLGGVAGTLAQRAVDKIVGDAVPSQKEMMLGGVLQEMMQAGSMGPPPSAGVTPEEWRELARTTKAMVDLTSAAGSSQLASSSQRVEEAADAANNPGSVPPSDMGLTHTLADAAVLQANANHMALRGQMTSGSLPDPAVRRPPSEPAKLTDNQDVLISDPNPPAMSIQYTPMTAGRVVKEVSSVAKDALTSAASAAGEEVAKGAVAAIGNMAAEANPRIRSLVANAMARLGRYTLSGVKNALSRAAKVVGDAPMVGTEGRKKVVGDAPPTTQGLGTDEDFAEASQLMASSRTAQLLVQVILLEQQCQTMVPLAYSVNRAQAMQAVVNSSTPDLSLYNHEPIDNSLMRCGMTVQPISWPYYTSGTTNAWRWVKPDVQMLRVALVELATAIPMQESPTAAAITPILLGAPMSDYSGTLRIKTMHTDMDQQLVVLGRLLPNLIANTAYSFAPELIRMLLYAAAWCMPYGDEVTQIMSGVAWKPTGNVPLTRSAPWPWMQDPNNPWDGAFAWVSLGEYVNALDGVPGAAGLWDNRFTPDTWDHSCAVIPITKEEMTDAAGNAVRILAATEYPLFAATWNGEWAELEDDEYATFAGQVANDMVALPNACATKVDGPMSAVLFVVVDMPRRAPGSEIYIGRRLGAMRMLTFAHTPQNPYVRPAAPANAQHPVIVEIGVTMDSDVFLPALARNIQRWERWYGASSDRSSALRLVADVCVRMGQPKIYTRKQAGIPDTLDGYGSGASPTTGLPPMYINNITPSFIMGALKLTTSASARLTETLYAIGSGGSLQESFQLGRDNSMMKVAVMRGLIKPMEEKSQVPLGPLAHIAEVLYEMGVLLTAVADAVLQENQQTVGVWYFHDIVNDPAQRALVSMNLRNVTWPALIGAWVAGIQYPACAPRYLNQGALVSNTVYQSVYGGSEAVTTCPVARVSWLGLQRHFASFGYSMPKIDFAIFSSVVDGRETQYKQLMTTLPGRNNRTYINGVWAYPQQRALVDELSKLTLTAIPDANHMNPEVVVCMKPNPEVNLRLGLPVTAPELAWSRAFTFSEFDGGMVDMRTGLGSLPMGAVLPSYDVRTGWVVIYAMAGYNDIFRMRGGSTSIKFIVNTTTVAATVDQPIFPEDSAALYTAGGALLQLFRA